MRFDFCTLFDENYLPRGLVLYRSLERTCPDFRLRVFCLDEATERILRRLALPRLVPIPLAELERHDPGLLAVKPTRSRVEYYWTATPALCLFALETEPELDAITYLDADLRFGASPQPVYDELGVRSILLVPHRYAPEYAASEETSGPYNVQFMVFRRDEHGLAALRWWRERCLEWCYDRVEDGKFGDQRYLDDWPSRFECVHVLEHHAAGLAPWNVARYTLTGTPADVRVDGAPLVFFHHEALTLYEPSRATLTVARVARSYRFVGGEQPLAWTSPYPISATERRLIWDPYVGEVGDAVRDVRAVEPSRAGLVPLGARTVLAEATPRPTRASVRRGLARLQPQALRRYRHRDSWKSAAVAEQMRTLALQQLARPRSVAPYRAFLEATELALARASLPEPARLLDVGCGVGQYSELLARHFPGRFAYTGADFAPQLVEAARAQWPDREFVVDDLLHTTLDLDAYDVILASGVVDVIPDYREALDILLSAAASVVVLHRQRITDGRSRAESAPGYEGQSTFRTFLNLADLERIARGHGRTIADVLPVEGDVHSFVVVREEA